MKKYHVATGDGKSYYGVGYESYRQAESLLKISQMHDPQAHIVEEDYPFTNADRIRSMNDEELAEFLVIANPTNCLECAFSCGWRCQPDRQDYSDSEKCVEGKKRWLPQPAEEVRK